MVTQTLAHEGNGHWREYAGGWSDVESARARQAKTGGGGAGSAAATSASGAAVSPAGSPSGGASGNANASRRDGARVKLSYKEQRELDGLPRRIADLEAEQKRLGGQLANPSTYQAKAGPGSAAQSLKAMNERVTAIEAELLTCLERWETLEARR